MAWKGEPIQGSKLRSGPWLRDKLIVWLCGMSFEKLSEAIVPPNSMEGGQQERNIKSSHPHLTVVTFAPWNLNSWHFWFAYWWMWHPLLSRGWQGNPEVWDRWLCCPCEPHVGLGASATADSTDQLHDAGVALSLGVSRPARRLWASVVQLDDYGVPMSRVWRMHTLHWLKFVILERQ